MQLCKEVLIIPLKEYQQAVIDDFDRWYGLLQKDKDRIKHAKSDLAIMQDAGISEDGLSAQRAKTTHNLSKIWAEFCKGRNDEKEWKTRNDHAGNSIPHICIKVPTGGGKTRIAAAILKQCVRKQRGLILWMMPSKTIEAQTADILKDKTHPIRQMLDQLTGNRVKIIKKDQRLSKNDLANNLCIMPLTIQSANRQIGSEFLKMNRPNGTLVEFFPAADSRLSIIEEFKNKYPGLDMISENRPSASLKNVIRMCRPVIILDEAHKAASKNFGPWAQFANNLGPSLVVELTATPNEEYSNILCTVTGKDLLAEQMIKKSVVLDSSKLNWQGTLHKAVKQLKKLDTDARKHEKYIRPIMVIRVELTDLKKYDKKDSRIHALDVQKYLTDKLGTPVEQVAIKTSSVNDLKGQNLMTRESPIRYIITHSALMEGWDCPFAYMLVILDNMQSQREHVQLLGRILRQPDIKYTDIESLNECYVYCIHDNVDEVIQWVQRRLYEEGFGHLENYQRPANTSKSKQSRTKRRKPFEALEIHLPKVSHRNSIKDEWVELDYEKHILANIPWDTITTEPSSIKKEALEHRQSTGVKIDIETNKDGKIFDSIENGKNIDPPRLSEWVAILSDMVPNAWHAARIIQEFWRSLNMSPLLIRTNESDLQNIFLDRLKEKIIFHAKTIFKDKIDRSIIKFDMQMSATTFKMPQTYDIDDGIPFLREDKRTYVQQSLFAEVYEDDFKTDPEKRFARYLDEAEAIEWWHRIIAKAKDEYYLRGWKKDRIYPDFVAVFNKKDKRVLRIYETKGTHLGTNADTTYKKKVLEMLSTTFNAGNLTVTGNHILEGEFKIMLEADIDNKIVTGLRKGNPAKALDLKPILP